MIRTIGTWPEAHLIAMWEETDPVELARCRAQDERFRRNSDWFAAHAQEIAAGFLIHGCA